MTELRKAVAEALDKAGTSIGAIRGWQTKRQQAYRQLTTLVAAYRQLQRQTSDLPARYTQGRLRGMQAQIAQAYRVYLKAAQAERQAYGRRGDMRLGQTQAMAATKAAQSEQI